MHSLHFVLVPELTLERLAAYHADVTASLRLYFSPAAPAFTTRFAAQSPREVATELRSRLLESDIRSTLVLMTSLEAHFQIDFNLRCRSNLSDALSVHFRDIETTGGNRVRLEDILEGWKRHVSTTADLIGQLRGAFKFRHWLAHGRYSSSKLGQKYDFEGVYLLASAVISGFPLGG